MYYSPSFKKEEQTSRFDRWRVNYDLLLRIIEAKEALASKPKDGDRMAPVKALSDERIL